MTILLGGREINQAKCTGTSGQNTPDAAKASTWTNSPSVTCWQSNSACNAQGKPDRTHGLHKIVDDYIAGGDAKKAVIAEHGFIEDWETSEVTSLFYLFHMKETFNADLSKVSTD